MRNFIFAFCAVFVLGALHAQTNVWQPSPGHTQMLIWPKTPPASQTPPGREYVKNTVTSKGEPLVWVCDVSQPTLTVYAPTVTNTGAAVIVFPGGGYNALAIDLEG